MASTYSYLSVMRLAESERSTGMSFRWRPFHLLVILQEMKHVPFRRQAGQIEVYAARYRSACRHIRFVAAASGALSGQAVGDSEPRCDGRDAGCGPDFVRAAYRRWYEDAQETGSEPNVSESRRDIGQEPARVLGLANTEDVKAALTSETDAARELGSFGSPTLVVDCQLFWGDDRLEDAISWCRHGQVLRR